jgi:hypothetical protein
MHWMKNNEQLHVNFKKIINHPHTFNWVS